MENCGAIMNFYGFTFGNYPVHCGANHPILLLNCCDERNVNLPLFGSCGDDDGKGGRIDGGQEVTMVAFNVERIAAQSPAGVLGDRMREKTPGSFSGRIEFTLQPAWCHTNALDEPLWEYDGSGCNFVTRNSRHKTVASSAERRSYAPYLGQEIFDTDVGCLLICTDPSVPRWVDCNGKEVR